jgi:hypothetical protein
MYILQRVEGEAAAKEREVSVSRGPIRGSHPRPGSRFERHSSRNRLDRKRDEESNDARIPVLEPVEMLDLDLLDPLAPLLVAFRLARDHLERRAIMSRHGAVVALEVRAGLECRRGREGA